jgi:acyl-CoA synthetase (AMP-forming)/AMP-acid ligase II
VIALGTLIARAALWWGDATAAVDEDGTTRSFSELDARSNRLGNAFRSLAGESRSPVAVMLPNSIEFLEADFASAKAGLPKLPINTRLTADERRWVLENSGAEILVTDEAGVVSIDGVRGELPALREIIVVGGSEPGCRSYEELVAEGDDRLPTCDTTSDDISVILYTSGTTGRPKGAASSFRGRLLTTTSMWLHELDVHPGDAMAHAGSMAHGSGSKSLAFFLRGAANVVIRKFDAEAFLRLLDDRGVTNTFVVPTMMQSMVDAVEAGGPVPSRLKTISYGGAPIGEALLRQAIERFGNVFVQVYGSCEAPHPITVLDKDAHLRLEQLAGSIGREVACAEVRLDASDEHGPGELLVRGESVMREYWNDPEATARAFVDGWYRTGDVATRDEEGYYSIVDRQREMIISGGLNVYPAEVERVIGEHPAVLEVAVVGVPDERWGESVAAFVVPAPGGDLNAEELLRFCSERLAAYKKPRLLEFRSALPKGSTGKVVKRELRDPYWSGHDRLVN